jgi:hypothetical protein
MQTSWAELAVVISQRVSVAIFDKIKINILGAGINSHRDETKGVDKQVFFGQKVPQIYNQPTEHRPKILILEKINYNFPEK